MNFNDSNYIFLKHFFLKFVNKLMLTWQFTKYTPNHFAYKMTHFWHLFQILYFPSFYKNYYDIK